MEPNPKNQDAYKHFINEISTKYKDVYNSSERRDENKILRMPGRTCEDGQKYDDQFIYFRVGEWPRMPARPEHCHLFLRFSSKVSGSCCDAASYIDEVYEIAKKHFPDYVHYWNECHDFEMDTRKTFGYYSWAEVRRAEQDMSRLVTITRGEDAN